MPKEQPLWYRLYFDAAYTDVACLVGYAGMSYRDFSLGLQKLIEKHGRRAEAASWHVVVFEGQNRTNVSPLAWVELRAEVRKLCFQLLGPPPESTSRRAAVLSSPAPEPPLDPAATADARLRTNRQLCCMLRDARKGFAHHGRHSFMGKESKKRLLAAEAEFRRRGLPIPPPGEEVPAKSPSQKASPPDDNEPRTTGKEPP